MCSIGIVFEYRIPWDAFRDSESGALADGRLMLHLTTTDGSTPPSWLWLTGPNVDLPFSAGASASATDSNAHSGRDSLPPAGAPTRRGGDRDRGVARSGPGPRRGPGPRPRNGSRTEWDASSKKRQPQPQRSRFCYPRGPSPYMLVALLPSKLIRVPTRYQLKYAKSPPARRVSDRWSMIIFH